MNTQPKTGFWKGRVCAPVAIAVLVSSSGAAPDVYIDFGSAPDTAPGFNFMDGGDLASGTPVALRDIHDNPTGILAQSGGANVINTSGLSFGPVPLGAPANLAQLDGTWDLQLQGLTLALSGLDAGALYEIYLFAHTGTNPTTPIRIDGVTSQIVHFERNQSLNINGVLVQPTDHFADFAPIELEATSTGTITFTSLNGGTLALTRVHGIGIHKVPAPPTAVLGVLAGVGLTRRRRR